MVETLDLTNNDDGMINISTVQEKIAEEKEYEKNININKDKMDATPINDVMQQGEMMEQPGMMMPPAMMTGPPAMMPPPQPMPVMEKKNPLNLTDEQMQAVIVAVCSIIAFSKPVQDRLGGFVPQFSADGSRTLTGLAISGVIVGVMFFISQRYL